MKMDVEGGEVGTLQSGERTLDSTERVAVEAYHRNPDPATADRACGPAVYEVLHRYRFRVAVTEDYTVFGWRTERDGAPPFRRVLFGLFSGRYDIDRV